MEIHWHNLEALREEETRAIEARLGALAANHTDLIDVRIVCRPTRHHRRGAQEVRITGQARGKEIVAARTREEVGLALNEALDAFEREVRRLRDRRRTRRHERPPEPPFLGIVDRVLLEEGYGFILTDGGEQVYFHRNAVKGGLEFERLAEGDRVGLNVEEGDKGPQANAVFPAPPTASAV
jgi:cold shock CspA family protein/ribosome-associated translation inhibitor RaiA